ncbi:MAG: hypothetical protein ACYDHB_11780 [Candidatus Dormibacteria bacterium]
MTAAALAQWQDQFLASGQAGLRSRETDERDLATSRMKAKIGEITMENELLRERARRAKGNHHFVVAEAETVAATVAPSAGRAYGLVMVCRVLELPRSTVYAARQRALEPAPILGKRGPKTTWSNAELTERIQQVSRPNLATLVATTLVGLLQGAVSVLWRLQSNHLKCPSWRGLYTLLPVSCTALV